MCEATRIQKFPFEIKKTTFFITYDTFRVVFLPKTIFAIFEIVLNSFWYLRHFEAELLDRAKIVMHACRPY